MDNEVENQRKLIASISEEMHKEKPLSEQTHPLVMENGISVCDVAKDYIENEKGRTSWIMTHDYDENIRPILDLANIKMEKRDRRMAAKAIVNFIRKNCNQHCLPLKRQGRK